MSSIPSSAMRGLARQLLAREAQAPHFTSDVTPLASVVDALRRSLSTLAGVGGFRVLIGRALTLAAAQAHTLSVVRVEPDGSLSGLEPNIHVDSEIGGVLVAHLLVLLSAFIGEGFMHHLLLEVWPDLSVFENSLPGGDSTHVDWHPAAR